MGSFGGGRINFVQVGLGTNSTFIQNLVGKPSEFDNQVWAMQTVLSEVDPERVTGISVEPVASLVRRLEHHMDMLPNVRLVQVALGESDVKDVDVHTFPCEMYETIIAQAAPEHREKLAESLQYMMNMSNIGDHPHLQRRLRTACNKFKVNIEIQQQKSEVWSWSRLTKVFNFKGCEVLLMDTEGSDAAILRSMIRHCQEYPDEWPGVVQFESMGLCDEQEGAGAEKRVLRAMEENGYITICSTDWNTFVVHRSVMDDSKIKRWIRSWRCKSCKEYGAPKPMYSNPVYSQGGYVCARCLWEHGSGELPSRQWAVKRPRDRSLHKQIYDVGKPKRNKVSSTCIGSGEIEAA